MLDAIAASAPTAKPRRGPSATPAAATITVTGCTPGMGANNTRPAAAMPPSVATRVRSRAVPPPCSSQANPPATSANAASTVARPPSAGSSAAQTTPASPSATNATRAALDRNGHFRGLVEQPGGERRLAVGVDPARGLVEHEQIRLGDRYSSDTEALALPARQV